MTDGPIEVWHRGDLSESTGCGLIVLAVALLIVAGIVAATWNHAINDRRHIDCARYELHGGVCDE